MTKADKEGQREAPILRFKGFTDAWEQRKIKDYVNYRRGSFPQPYGKKEWYGGNNSMPFVQVVDVKENLHLADHTKQRISKLAQPKSVFVPAGEVLVTVQGSIGKVAITQYPSYIDRTLIVFEKYNTRTDKYFWAYTLQRKFEIEKRKAPGGTIKTITKKALSDFSIPITNYEEQGYLGTFFLKVDKLLTLYDRKLKLLSQVKKYFLDNLFTEKEYPNLRFKGFTDAWEQRKLEEVTLFIRNGVTIKQNGSYGIPITRIESISTGTLNLSKVGYADIQTDKYKGYYLKNNDILFSNINSLEHIGKVAFVQHLSLDVIHGMNLLNIRINEKSISSKFIYYQLLIMKYNNLFKKIAKPAVNQASIATSELKKLVIKVPAVNEQCKIQALLTCLEKIITLYESKKQNLNKIKNTLLNTMFI